MGLAELSCRPWIVPSGRMVLVVVGEPARTDRCPAQIRRREVGVGQRRHTERLALVRFCPAKFQPVRLLPSSPMPWRFLAW